MEQLAAQSRLVLLRGIGTENARRLDAVGVRSIADLGAQDPLELTEALSQIHEPGWWPRARRVAVWIAAARHAVE
jgi:predicted RecB family nuclease